MYNETVGDKMKKIFKLIAYIIIISIIVTGCTSKKENSDSIKFKEEYESINNEKNKKTGKKNRAVTISKDNPFIYSSAEEVLEKMNKKESFIVYFGFKDCPWCRSIIEELVRALKDKKVEKIYYVDVTGIRDEKELDEDGNVVTTSEGTEAYKSLIEKMSNVLEDYTLKKDDEKIETGEKRIYAPNIVAISKGKAIQLETGISEKLEDPYGELTKEIKNYSYNKFKCLIECLEEESTTCQKNMC